jgi:FKBP-type peptidyl-prolyl cis-trans isomerase
MVRAITILMKIPRGIKIKDRKIGTGPLAEKGRIAVIHYDCFLPRGEKCFSSRDRSYPAQFHIGQREVFPGIEYGIAGMAVGGTRSIKVSPHLTYYERKLIPDLPENVVLRYEVELLKISDQWDNTLYSNIFPYCGVRTAKMDDT